MNKNKIIRIVEYYFWKYLIPTRVHFVLGDEWALCWQGWLFYAILFFLIGFFCG